MPGKASAKAAPAAPAATKDNKKEAPVSKDVKVAPAAPVAPVDAASILQNLEERLANHSKSINTFLTTIPSKFYVVDDLEEVEHRSKYKQNPSGKAMKKNELKAKKQAAKQARLDPEKAKSIEELQKEMEARQQGSEDEDEDEDEFMSEGDDDGDEEGEEEEGSDLEGSDGEDEGEEEDEDEDDDEEEGESRAKRAKADAAEKKPARPMLLSGPLRSAPAASLEELRQRLHDKIAQTQGKRKVEGVEGRAAKKSKRDKEKEKEKEKQKKLGKQLAHSDAKDRVARPAVPGQKPKESEGAIQFSKFDFAQKEKKKARPSTKKLLEKAQTEQEKLQKLAETNVGKAEKVAHKQAWQKALQRADGEKVFDDPTLLKKTLKRKRQEKNQSAKAWNKRIDFTEREKKERIEKRERNIKERQDARKDRKMGKKPKKTPAKKKQKNDKFVKGKAKFVPKSALRK